jgi:hypothetical protein
MVQVSIQADETRARVIVRIPAGTRWATFEATVTAFLEAYPQTADWNWVLHEDVPFSDVDIPGLGRIAALYRQLGSSPAPRTFTVVVTADPFFPDWARVIDMHFENRRHLAAPTAEAAGALLDRLDAERTSPESAARQRG